MVEVEEEEEEEMDGIWGRGVVFMKARERENFPYENGFSSPCLHLNTKQGLGQEGGGD